MNKAGYTSCQVFIEFISDYKFKKLKQNLQKIPSLSTKHFDLPFIEIVLSFHMMSPPQWYSKGPGIWRFSVEIK